MAFKNFLRKVKRFFGLEKIAVWAEEAQKQIPEQVDELTKDVAREILEYLTNATPVDTGKAISNWQVGINSSPSGEISAHSPGKKGSTKDENVQITNDIGNVIIASQKGREAIHVVNTAEYILELETGKSTQNQGFIEAAEQIAIEEIEKGNIVLEP